MVLRQPHRERAQAAQRQKHVVGSGADAEQPDRFGDQRPGLGVGRDRAEHDVGMAADIFGRGLHADVDALIQRAVIQRRRPGVVVDHERAARMRNRSDRGNVGHFEGLRAGRLDQHRLGVGLEQLRRCRRRSADRNRWSRRRSGPAGRCRNCVWDGRRCRRPGDDRRHSAPPAGWW